MVFLKSWKFKILVQEILRKELVYQFTMNLCHIELQLKTSTYNI